MSDSRGSEETPISANIPVKKQPPFKIWFPKQRIIGRSNIQVSEVDAKFVTPKIYSPINYDDHQVRKMVREKMERAKMGPRDVLDFPLLSSQSYGWWYDQQFESNDGRFKFHRNTSDLVLSNCSIIQCKEKNIHS